MPPEGWRKVWRAEPQKQREGYDNTSTKQLHSQDREFLLHCVVVSIPVVGRCLSERRRRVTLAVRYYHRLPLHLRTAHDWSGAADRRHADHLAAHRQRCLVPAYQVLRKALSDQLRDRRRDRDRAGIPVRDELE